MTNSRRTTIRLHWAAAGLVAATLTLSLACRDRTLIPESAQAPVAMSGSPVTGQERPLAVGQKAPDFSLSDSTGAPVTLSSFQGKSNVVLVFYPGDETRACIAQLCAIRDDYVRFQQAGIVVFGVNPSTAQSHSKFREHHRYPFELLVDTGNRVAGLYHAQATELTTRTVYGIDKTGTIVFAKRGMPTDEKILAAFEKK